MALEEKGMALGHMQICTSVLWYSAYAAIRFFSFMSVYAIFHVA